MQSNQYRLPSQNVPDSHRIPNASVMLRYVYMPYWWLNSLKADEQKKHVSKGETNSAFSFDETESFPFSFCLFFFFLFCLLFSWSLLSVVLV